MLKKLTKRDLYFLMFTYLFRILIEWCYYHVIVELYEYYGFRDNRNMLWGLLSWGVLISFSIMILPIVQDTQNRVSSLVIIILFFLDVVPFTSLIYAGIFSLPFIFFKGTYWLFLIFLQMISLKKKIKNPPTIKFGK